MRIWVKEYLGDNKAVWECPNGHTWTGLLMPKKQTKVGKIGETGYRMMAKWWRKEAGGVTDKCPKCEKSQH